MSNIIKWIAAIENEDGDNISAGSSTTLTMIEREVKRIEEENRIFRKSLEQIERFAADCCLDSHTQMKEAIENVLGTTEAVKLVI